MAINRHISHLKSSGGTAPAAADLYFGEIAIGYKAGEEYMYIKNSDGNIVSFAPAIDILECTISGTTGTSGITLELSDCAPGGRNLKGGLATVGTPGTYKQVVVDAYGRVTSGNTADNNTFREIKTNGTPFLASSTTTALNLSGGTNVTLTTGSTGLLTISATDTTYTADETFIKLNGTVFSAQTGTSSSTLARGNHNHNGTYAKSAFTTVKVGTTDVVADSTADTLTLSAGTFVTVTPDATNDKVTFGVSTGTTSSTLARGDHSHTNMVTGSNLTANKIILGAGNSTISASAVEIETAVTASSDEYIPTSKAIATYVESQMVSVLTYKGSITSNDGLKVAHKVGDVYVVATAGTYAGKSCEVGDYIICKVSGDSSTTVTNSHWDVINGENQVDNKSATLVWNSAVTIATVDGTDITAKLPQNPNSWRNVTVNGTEKLTTATTSGSLDFASGSTNGTISVEGTDVVVTGVDTAAYHPDTYFAKSAFTTVKVGTTDIVADSTGDTLTLSAGTFVTVTPDATNDKVTFGVSTGTTSSTLARGDHSHDGTYAKSAFTTVKVGTTDVVADSTADTLTLSAGTFVTVTPDATNDKVTFGVSTGTSSSTLARGDHNHDGTYAKSAFTKVMINSTALDADSTGDTLTISGGSFISLTPDATNDKVTISAITGTTSSSLARGDHSHSSYVNQNAFSNVKVGSVTVAADTTTDTVEFEVTNTKGTDGLTISGDATNDKVTINLGDIVCGDYA